MDDSTNALSIGFPGCEMGIRIARESLTEVKDVIQGVQVSAPFGNVKYALQVFEALDGFNLN